MAEVAQAKPSTGKYFGSLDGYRAFGTFVVVMHHVPFIFIRTPFAYGWWVLQSFFVISGFLLTLILLKDKAKGYAFKGYLKEFYLKRFYRIFPLYWAFLALLAIIVFLFGTTQIPLISGFLNEYKVNWWLFWTYTYNYKDLANFLQNIQPDFNPFLSHLWSLSVEEQFYLMLPFMVYFLSLKNLKRLVLGIIILSPLARLATYFYFNSLAQTPEYSGYFNGSEFMKNSWVAVIMLRSTWCQLDCLAFGMALALWDFTWIKSAKKWFWWSFLAFFIIVTLNGIYTATKIDTQHIMDLAQLNPILRKTMEIFPMWFVKFYSAVSEHLVLIENYHFVYIYTIVNFLSFLIVMSCIRNKPFLSFMGNDKMVYTGKITYGAYLFHYPLLMIIIIFSMPIMAKISKISTKIISSFFGDYIGLIGSQIASELVMIAIYLPALWYLSKYCFEYFEMYFIKLKYKVKAPSK
ncbi:MAG: acyltransferase [Chitinophagales bacterium]|nr:acyltransferase [Chitinophagales bacterium]